jgi:hypothetical protein
VELAEASNSCVSSIREKRSEKISKRLQRKVSRCSRGEPVWEQGSQLKRSKNGTRYLKTLELVLVVEAYVQKDPIQPPDHIQE